MTVEALLQLVLRDALWSALAAAAFAILFNVPRRTLLGCAACGAVGHSLRALLLALGWSIEAGTLFGATVVGFMGIWLAHAYKVPATVFTLSGSIPMVPGVYAYRAMLGFIQVTSAPVGEASAALVEAGVNAIATGLILAAIGIGITAPGLLFRRPKPVV
jgi:uncharacterized membrane protein YjjB (DUF3815 family)